MAVFCGKCGAPVPEGSGFCTVCGAQVIQAAAPVPPAYTPPPPPPPAAYTPPPPAYPPPPVNAYGQAPNAYGQTPNAYGQPVYAAPAAVPNTVKKGGSGTKIVLIVLGVLFFTAVIVVGGIIWEVHRVVNKVKSAAADAGLSSADMSSLGDARHMEACKYLSAGDVSAAIGVPIIDAKSDDSGCHYIASGSADQFTMGHIKAMTGGSIPGLPTEAPSTAASTETTSLVDISIDSHGGRTQMKLQKALIGGLGINGTGNGNLNGIGDEAFVIGNNQLVMRKGDMFIQITYTNCPCSATQIAPLAKKLADAL